MLKIIALIVVVLIAAVLAYAAVQSDTFRIQRSVNINAPTEKIFAVLSDFRQSQSWSPYEKKDPAMKRSLSGSPSGKGSVYEFSGNKEVGKGRLEITDAVPPSKVTIALDIVEPFTAHNIVEYTLQAKGATTDVTWAMNGHSPFIARIMCLFFDMDKMVGKDFEAGLASLKALTET